MFVSFSVKYNLQIKLKTDNMRNLPKLFFRVETLQEETLQEETLYAETL